MDTTTRAEVALPNQSAVAERLSERLGALRVRDPESGKLTTAPVSRIELLRADLAPGTFNAAMGWLMSPKIKSDHTARNYADDIRTVARALASEGLAPFDVTTLKPSVVTLAAARMEAAGHSARTINRRLNAVQSLYSFWRIVVANTEDAKVVTRHSRPKMDESAVSANATRALTSKELSAMFSACRGPRELLAISLTVAVAGRAEELCRADLSHIRANGDSEELVLHRKGGKVRAFELPDEVRALIYMVHGEARSGAILLNSKGEPMTRYALDALLQRLGRQARVRTCPRAYSKRKDAQGRAHRFDKCRECRDVTPHVLRATKLTQLHVEDKWDLARIQRFADHASPETTAGYIARWQDAQDRAAGAARTGKDIAKYVKRFAENWA